MSKSKFLSEAPFIRLLYIVLTLSAILLIHPVAFAQIDTSGISIDKAIPDTLLFRIEKVQAAIAQINAANKKGYNISRIKSGLKSTKINVEQIKAALRINNPLPPTKDLDNYRIMLADIQKNAGQWRKSLSKSNSDLQRMSGDIIQFSRDSLLNTDEKDTTQKTLYLTQISDLKQRLQQSGQATVAHLDSVSRLLADVSSLYFTATDLYTSVNDYVKDADQNVLGQEAGYLWEAPVIDRLQTIGKMLQVSYVGQDKILRYFFSSTWDNRILLFLLVAGFFTWIYVNFKLISRRHLANKMGPLDFKLITPMPILSCLVVLFNLTPLFEPHSPSIYIEVNQFLLLITLTVLFRKTLDRAKLRLWVMLLILYFVVMFFNIIVNESLVLRLCLILVSTASIYFGIRYHKNIGDTGLEEKFTKPVLFIHIGLTVLSILFNVFGRISLAKSFNITGISGVVQIISLAAFIQIISEAMELHIKVSSCSGGLFSKININRSRNSLKNALSLLSVWLWLLVFLINLNILDPVFNAANHILDKERTFGSLAFTLSNVLFFSVIIYLANMLQKNIGVFFGETEIDFESNKIQKGSKLALLRLVIIVLGFLFAITVSGVPLTKITVLLGALGVGIGLGLQNIINNFVSGIILIFEKPFSIGDYIELADKKGKVLEIGIRSSQMLTSQGSRVIIPNGDLLSGRLVNYTLHNSHLKVELTFKISTETDLEMVKKLIAEIAGKGENIVKNAPVQVLFNAVTTDSIEFKVLVWLNDVYAEATFRSYFLEQILQKCKENGIKLM
ncbi:mechanosensitive ion channel family protein [Dyadobacter sp. NIV53]|uniref:mechanosensitive ion channel family protein n=1 Tax=Dyadobacter sp. NIV53 TaxID=2861765 RepID=UPI001C877085|nr:mechanosensitive ion channel domain-containing protein [Dyadobacter sp. NIV53]